jgi:hypothetical protein
LETEGKRPHGNIGIDGKIILKCIWRNKVWEYGLDSTGSGYGPVVGSCEYSNKPSGSIKKQTISWPTGQISFSKRTLDHGVC